MTSLCPGPLFKSPGLNNYSTPSSRTDTPAVINSRFSRIPFNSVPWPKASPVSKVYDVRNSSTSMILLNNKYSRKACRLRGQTSYDGDVKGPDPDRHLSETPHVNRRSHMDCADSSSPVFKPEKRTGLRWCNSSQRPPIKFEDGSSVNYKRHTTCMVSEDLRTMNWRRPQRPYSTSIIRESMRSRSPLLEDLNPGERLYMYSIARLYSVDKMRKQKQSQYCHLLHREVERGLYSPEECERYWRYLNRPRKTQQGSDDSFQRRRTKSAPGRRSEDRQNDRALDRSESGRQSEASRSFRSKSRGSSRPLSRASVASSRYYKKKSNDQNGHSDIKQDETSNHQSPKKASNPQTPKKSSDSQTPKKSEPKYISMEKSKEQDPVKRIPVESDEDEDAQYEAQVRGLDRVRDSESSDSDAPTREPRHREGKDRPKSRLGGRKKDAVRKKDTSDDDYSSDTSVSSSDESHTDRTSQSKSTSEPTSKMSQSNQNKQPQPEKITKESKPKGDSQADNKLDSSYSEDFTETSASQSVSHSKGDKSDTTESKGDNSATKQSDSSESQTISQSVSMSQSKTTSSDQTTLGSTKGQTETSTSLKADDSSTMKSTEQTTESNDAALKSSSDDGSKAEKSNESKVTEKDKVKEDVKVTDKVNEEGKATDDVKKEVKTDTEEVKVADESYSDDFTDSKSEESKKPAEISTRPDNADKDGRAVAGGEKGTESSTNQRRDSIELDGVRDWDKIEY